MCVCVRENDGKTRLVVSSPNDANYTSRLVSRRVVANNDVAGNPDQDLPTLHQRP